jgi:hypothetical protein
MPFRGRVEVRGWRNLGTVLLLLALSLPADAEVYQAFPLQPVETMVMRNFGRMVAPPLEMTVQGQKLRISRWLLPLDMQHATSMIEAEIGSLLAEPGEALDAIQTVHDDAVVFAALSPLQPPAGSGGPRFSRTLALHPVGFSTELVVTDDIDPSAPLLAPEVSWSLDGVTPPQWSGVEYAADGSLATLMFVYPPGSAGIEARREQQLREKNFDILDITGSDNGKMLSARNGQEIISVFSFVDDDGSFVEVLNYQRAGSASPAGAQ